MKSLYLDQVDSTNTYLKTHYQKLDHFTWLYTNHQTNGRGRLHKVWYGDKDSLMCSVLLKTDLDKAWINLIPLLAAKSLHLVLYPYHNDIKIKWPNDLLINQLKLSGILVESIIEKDQVLAVVVGFGININQIEFRDEIKDIATSLSILTKQIHDKNIIYEALQKQFYEDFQAFILKQTFVIDYCNKYLAFKDQMITYKDHETLIKAKVIKINQDGYLIVEKDHHKTLLSSGEISICK